MNDKLLDESPFTLDAKPKDVTKADKRNGYHYLGESGGDFVYEYLKKAIANTKQDTIIDYEGKSRHTMKSRWYMGRKYLEFRGFKEFDFREFKIAFKDMFGIIKHDIVFRLKKEYSPPKEYKVKTREEWKKELLSFIGEGREGDVFELKDCIQLLKDDKKFLSSITDGICETEVMTDTWLRLKHL